VLTKKLGADINVIVIRKFCTFGKMDKMYTLIMVFMDFNFNSIILSLNFYTTIITRILLSSAYTLFNVIR